MPGARALNVGVLPVLRVRVFNSVRYSSAIVRFSPLPPSTPRPRSAFYPSLHIGGERAGLSPGNCRSVWWGLQSDGYVWKYTGLCSLRSGTRIDGLSLHLPLAHDASVRGGTAITDFLSARTYLRCRRAVYQLSCALTYATPSRVLCLRLVRVPAVLYLCYAH